MNRTFFKICTLSALAWLSSSIAYAENSSIILVKDSTGSSLEKQAQYNSIESFTRKDNTSDWIKTKVTQADKSFQVLNNEEVLLNNEISFAWNFNEKISLSLNVFDNYLVSTPLNSVSARIVIPGNGVHGYGGTTQAQQLDIIEASSSNVLARINPSIGVREIWLPVQQSSDYYIQTSQPQIPRGDNPSYTLFWQTLSQQNQQETNNVANNNSAGAETPSSFPNGIYTSYFIGGTLAGAIDTDWWRFNANAGDIVNLYCDSWHTGSGVRNFTAQIYFNPMNPALQTGTESQTAGLVWANTTNATAPPVNITNSGVHYLMIHASLFANDVVGRHYQCGIHVQSP